MRMYFTSHALLRAIYLGLVAVIVTWQLQWIARQPVRYYPQRITIALAAGESRNLGGVELAARQAELNHLRLRRAADGHWWASNASEERTVEVTRHGRDQLLRTMPLTARTRFSIGGGVFLVSAIDAAGLHLHDPAGRAWLFDGDHLSRADGQPHGVCPVNAWFDPAGYARRLAWWVAPYWNWTMPAHLGIKRRLDIGGSLNCENLIALPGMQRGVARIVRVGADGFVLIPAADSARLICLSPDAPGACASANQLQQHETSLDGMSRLVLGRTHYGVAIGRDQLQLTPLKRVALYQQVPAPKGVKWELARADAWHWPLALPPSQTLAAGVALMLMFALWLRRKVRGTGAFGATVWLAGVAVVAPCTVAAAAVVLSGASTMSAALAGMELNAATGGWLLAVFGALWWLRRFRQGVMPAGAVAMLTLGAAGAVIAAGAYQLETALGAGWTVVLQAGALAAVAALPRRGRLAWTSFALAGLLFAIGAVTQLSLGLQGGDSGSLRFFQRFEAVVAGGLFAWLVLAALPRAELNITVGKDKVRAAMIRLAAVVMFLLALQTLRGSEAGLGILQPTEMAKLLLVLYASTALTALLDWNGQTGLARLDRVGRFVVPVLVLVFAVCAMLAAVRDMSPLALIAFWCGGMTLAWSFASKKWLGAIMAATLLATTLAAIAFLRAGCGLLLVCLPSALLLAYLACHLAMLTWNTPGAKWWRWLPPVVSAILCAGVLLIPLLGDETVRLEILKFERFIAWLQPELHPHTGAQANGSDGLRSSGGLTGNDEVDSAWAIPEIQNDMNASYFLAVYGVAGGCALLALQMLYLACLTTAAVALLDPTRPRTYLQHWLARVVFFAVIGDVLFLAATFLMSWGCNLGILPIMGQPMPFLSAAGSLVLLLLVPLQSLLNLPLQMSGAGTEKSVQFT